MQVSVSNSKIRRLNFWPNIARLYIEISMPFRSIALEWISLNFLSRPFRPFIRRAEREGKKKTNSTIIESSIRLGSIFQSRYYLPAATFISRCDSVATVLIPSFPPFFFFFFLFRRFSIFIFSPGVDFTDRIARIDQIFIDPSNFPPRNL